MTVSVVDLLTRADVAVRAGQPGAAEIIYQQLLKSHPGNAEVLCHLGLFRERQGKTREGIALLQKAVQLKPDCYDIWYHLGSLLRRAKQFQPAVEALQRAVGLDDRNPRAWLGLAQCCIDVNDRQQALQMLANAVSCDKANHGAARSAALLAEQSGRSHLAVQFFRLSAPHYPDDQDFQFRFAAQLYKAEFAAESLDVLEHRFPVGRAWQADALRANCLFLLQRFDELDGLLPTLERLWPERQGAFISMRVKALASEGRNDQARQMVDEALARFPAAPELWYQLCSLAPRAVDKQRLQELELLFQKSDGPARLLLSFALAEVYEVRVEYARQLEVLQEGNALAASEAHYDPESDRILCAERQAKFSAAVVNEVARSTSISPDLRPVFIVGLPRSGTTLLERVLGAHSEVMPLGESLLLKNSLHAVAQSRGLYSTRHLFEIPLNDWIEPLRAELLKQLARRGVEGGYFTDKSMDNWYSIGLLKAAFPEARFIRMDRHPMDVGFGCFKQHFATPIPFTNSFEAIAETCSHFDAMLNFWQAQDFTPHRMSYESLVADLEQEVKAMLTFLGLPFEQQCLEFHKAEGRVMTASVNQVRRGLYTGALDRWRRYGDLLRPLEEAFARRGIDVSAYRPVSNARG